MCMLSRIFYHCFFFLLSDSFYSFNFQNVYIHLYRPTGFSKHVIAACVVSHALEMALAGISARAVSSEIHPCLPIGCEKYPSAPIACRTVQRDLLTLPVVFYHRDSYTAQSWMRDQCAQDREHFLSSHLADRSLLRNSYGHFRYENEN